MTATGGLGGIELEQRRLGKGGNRRRAAATVELAVLLPLLVFLFVIAVDFARVFYFSLTVENCARNGALYGSDPLAPSQSPYKSTTDAALADASNLQPQPTVTSTNGTDLAGNAYVEVTVAWQFASLTNFPGVPNSTNLSRTVRMQVAPTTPK
jgi:Flp pilus assembly protein TadG